MVKPRFKIDDIVRIKISSPICLRKDFSDILFKVTDSRIDISSLNYYLELVTIYYPRIRLTSKENAYINSICRNGYYENNFELVKRNKLKISDIIERI